MLNVIFLLLVLFSPISLAADRAFHIEGIIEPPLRWYDQHGEAVGIDIDIITQALAKMTDIIPSYHIKL